ncbi:MAG: class I SAM-dependent methyltransferase [Anaerolineae bacterium]|nr:class I SAM-dependent methyltransferase [Anaerolineae bacterium]
MAGIDRSRRISFEEQAERYDATASGYPAEIIDDIVKLAKLSPGGRILEIGCGSGQATISFAERGYAIVAVELGERLAQLAANKLRSFPLAQVIHHEFESWPLPPQPFDLVLSAEAFHWIVPQVGIPKLAQALVPGGMVALLWSLLERMDTPLHRAIAAVYAETASDWPNPLSGEVNADFIHEATSRSFAQVGGFEPLQSRTYTTHHTTTLNGAAYIEELRTFSSHRTMPEATRRDLYAAIQAAFQAHEDRLMQNIGYQLLYTHPLNNM